jgi:Tol biopolymer transport system component
VEIYSMNATNGSALVRLTNNQSIDAEPSWGATNRILFISTREGWTKIFVMNHDGSGVIQLTEVNTGLDLSPDW